MPDFLALEILDRVDGRIDAGDHGHAAVAGRANDDHGLTVGGAERGGGEAVNPEIDGPGDNSVFAVGRALEGEHLHRGAGGHEFLIEVGRDAVDEFERADLDDPVVRHCAQACGR